MAQCIADLDYAQHQLDIFARLARENSTRMDEVTLWKDEVASGQAAKDAAKADLAAAQDQLNSNINGVNTSVANIQAQLQEAQHYLDNSGAGGRAHHQSSGAARNCLGHLACRRIAALIVEKDRYVLATYYQENLKYVRPGQYAEMAFNLRPEQQRDGAGARGGRLQLDPKHRHDARFSRALHL